MATHSAIPAWRILWTEEPGGLHGGHKVGHDRACIEGQTDRRRRYQKGSTQFCQISRNFCYLLCCPMEQKTVAQFQKEMTHLQTSKENKATAYQKVEWK